MRLEAAHWQRALGVDARGALHRKLLARDVEPRWSRCAART